MDFILILFIVLIAAGTLAFLALLWNRKTDRQEIVDFERTGALPVHTLTKFDFAALAGLLLVYSAVAFAGLGSTVNPQSFYEFSDTTAHIDLTLDSKTEISRIQYYAGADVGNYFFCYSEDSVNWSTVEILTQSKDDVLKWLEWSPETPVSATVIRLFADANPLHLGEFAVRDGNGELVRLSGCDELTDEQNTVPQESSYFNGTYFDEIYHVRTAWEFITEVPQYETTHPPLGKLLISFGIRLFGLNPFGWRVIGVLFGIFSAAVAYVFLKNLIGGFCIPLCVSAVFAFDFMHFTQTRIATIDTYVVFFVLAMYWCFYRWFALPYDAPVSRKRFWLFLSGLSFALGAATKWNIIFSAAGLAILWCVKMAYSFKHSRRFRETWLPTVLWSTLSFVALPVTVYLFAYIPVALGNDVRLLSGDYIKMIGENIGYMFYYHSNLVATHPYQSVWWQWLLDYKPILYITSEIGGDKLSSITAFGCPLFWWTGLGAIVCMITRAVRKDKTALFISVGYLSALLPWVLVTRNSFIYHYFPCTVFLALAVGWLLAKQNRISRRAANITAICLAAGCIALFAVFYTALSGFTAALSDNYGAFELLCKLWQL